MLVSKVETAILKFADYAKATFGGKIVKDHYLTMKGIPEECRLLRPDLVVQNSLAKKIYVFEFACPFAKIYQNGDALKQAYDFKEGKYARLCEEIKMRFQGWDVQQVTMIVSSLGAVYEESLKRLTSTLDFSPNQTVRLGHFRLEINLGPRPTGNQGILGLLLKWFHLRSIHVRGRLIRLWQ
jgi:hypothetical protein